jgi:hypothetical protein
MGTNIIDMRSICFTSGTFPYASHYSQFSRYSPLALQHKLPAKGDTMSPYGYFQLAVFRKSRVNVH